MNDTDIALEAKKFSMDWYERGYEKGETQKFWLTLLQKILRVDESDKIIEFEVPVSNGYIDAYLPATKVLIEQKSFDVPLDNEVFAQAKRYADAMPDDKKPRWIITCNFSEFRIYNLAENLFKPRLTTFKLRELIHEYSRLNILIDPNADDSSPQERISRAALADIEKIYDAFKLNYQKNKVSNFEDDLNKICMRLVFCLYAGDAKVCDTVKRIFDTEKIFGYISKFDRQEKIDALQKIFDVFGLEIIKRTQKLDDDLKNFPYVDGGLFDEKIPLPAYSKFATNPVVKLENVKGIRNFRWREISPPVFGAMFESKFSRREEQREHGVFYTSIENIHKVIDPLFFDDLSKELADIKRMQKKNRVAALKNFQDKIASLNFLDPACGSGNFLTETYLSLRRLENEIIEELHHLYADLPTNPIKVTPRQFYGIEIDSFAAAVARLALCIADIQMKRETSWIINRELPELPLDKFVSIQKANALRVDWKAFAPHVDFIIGNPPYRGHQERTPVQIDDMKVAFPNLEKHGKLDYVCAWHNKAAEFVRGTEIRCAFLSTNSICQGETAQVLWKFLFDKGIHIDFARRTFKWQSDSDNQASVHCVVVGFSSAPNVKPKKIFDGDKVIIAQNINAFLVDAPNIFIKNRGNPPKGFPKMTKGSQPTDGKNLIIKADDLDEFLRLEPASAKYIRLYLGADEFIDGKKRYCLWLVGVPMSEIEKMPLVMERIEKVREARLKSDTASVRRDADKPTLFTQIRQPTTNFLCLPRVSSERRKYIPIGFLPSDIIISDAALIIPDATLYLFGMLTSSIHMAWLKTFCGRLKSDYRYSPALYNNFPWCSVNERQRRLIERSAQEILNVRAFFQGNREIGQQGNNSNANSLIPYFPNSLPQDWTLAKLYNEDTMPDELKAAHKWNDFNVALAYGFEKFLDDEARIVAELMKLYKRLTKI